MLEMYQKTHCVYFQCNQNGFYQLVFYTNITISPDNILMFEKNVKNVVDFMKLKSFEYSNLFIEFIIIFQKKNTKKLLHFSEWIVGLMFVKNVAIFTLYSTWPKHFCYVNQRNNQIICVCPAERL